MQDWPFNELVVWIFLAILYYAFATYMGLGNMTHFRIFMFGGYIDLWNLHFAPLARALLQNWANPFVLMLGALLLWRWRVMGVISLTRSICAIIAGIFLVRVAVYVFDLYPVHMTLSYAATGAGAFVWYIASAYLVDAYLKGRLQALLERLRSD